MSFPKVGDKSSAFTFRYSEDKHPVGIDVVTFHSGKYIGQVWLLSKAAPRVALLQTFVLKALVKLAVPSSAVASATTTTSPTSSAVKSNSPNSGQDAPPSEVPPSSPSISGTPTPAPTTTPDPLAVWYDSYGSNFQTLENDIETINGEGQGQLGALQSACQQLGSDVTQAQSVPAIPDSQMNNAWVAALNELSDGASMCYNNLGANYDPNAVNYAEQQYIDPGDSALYTVQDSILGEIG